MKKLFLSTVLVFVMALSVFASDNSLWEKSTLNQIMKRGELRVGL
ncbi:MAG: amino acid ABC transporter substrate-binding protein, partial [Deferribacterales bacterium]|nr:amino acid ABC transporter substrate-binding protein [Deferribacterales bacterium]